MPGSTIAIPEALARACGEGAGAVWLGGLPGRVAELARRWSLALHPPFVDSGGSCAWVAPVTRADGSAAVLKLGLPHMEAEQEIAGLRFWDGESTVRVIEGDEDLTAMLLEA